MVAVTFLLPLYWMLSRLGVLTVLIENQLFDHYSSSKKPRINQSDLVEGNISMTIQTLLEVNERFHSISFYGWFKVQWQDDFWRGKLNFMASGESRGLITMFGFLTSRCITPKNTFMTLESIHLWGHFCRSHYLVSRGKIHCSISPEHKNSLRRTEM